MATNLDRELKREADMALLQSAWEEAWDAVGADPRTGFYETMVARYDEPKRHYHNLHHLAEGFDVLRSLRHHCDYPHEVSLGFWFHDAFYDTTRRDNEERSAQLAEKSLLKSGADVACAKRVGTLVRYTDHHRVPRSIEAGVILDCDLWILGAPRARFDEYESQVRAEFSAVSDTHYMRARMRVLRNFERRAHIFLMPEAREMFETQARSNIAYSIEKLARGIMPPPHYVDIGD